MGAAFNALMEEETKESLAKMCCDLIDEINSKSTGGGKTYEFLNETFLTLMNDIGRLGHEKFGADCIEARGDGKRRIERHSKDSNMYHARGHITNYLLDVPHDKLNTVGAHLAAVAFNAMVEYFYWKSEQGK